MKAKYILFFLIVVFLMSFASCSLDKDPMSEYSEVNYGKVQGDTTTVYTYAEMKSQYQSLYQLLKDRQEHWYEDLLLIAESHADNAYAGTTGAEVVPFETNAIDGSSSVMDRDWTRYLADVAQANIVVDKIDSVKDTQMTNTERTHWKAEAKIFRAMIWFDMVRMWGNIPVVTKVGPNITSKNIEQVWKTYYPSQVPAKDVYTQIVSDLTDALQNAPDVDPSNKTILSKGVAAALLAKVYAEKPLRDYNKVVEYCNDVINDGYSLVSNYKDLFGMNDVGTDARARSTSESILEINYPSTSGNWVTWMFGKDLLNPNYGWTWAKWVTPSRDLINDYNSEKDTTRFNQTIVYYQCTWNNYYPSNHYPFMYKCRSAASSIIKIRLADILLLKAEALANLGGDANLQAAAQLVDQIRERAHLKDLPASTVSSQTNMVNAVLHERRLELAFEGQRWFDLVRYGKMETVMNAVYSKDSGRLSQKEPFTTDSELLPVPQAEIDVNPNLVQNPGY